MGVIALDIGMAFLQPSPARQPFLRIPAVVAVVIAFLAAVHLVRGMAGPFQAAVWVARYAFTPIRYSPAFLALHGAGESVWTLAVPFVSHMALHNDIMHLAINSLWLLAFGPVVARRFGPVLFLVFFCVCGVAGAAAYLALNWGSPVPMIGASGAISGLMAAGLRLLPALRPDAGPVGLMPVRSRQFLLFALVWGGINILAGVTGLGMGGESGLIAWQAHLGGFLAGTLLTGPFDRFRPQPVGVALD
jgi:membrane associated rhomboid family serine protease